MTQLEYLRTVDRAYDAYRGEQLEQKLKDIVNEAREEYGEISGVYASMLSELGSYYRGQGRLKESERAFQHVVRLLKKTVGDSGPAYANAVNSLGGTYRLMGEYDKAEHCFSICLSIYGRTVGAEHVLYASALNNLALLEMDRGRLDSASVLLKQASQILKLYPEKKDEYATSVVNLAALYRAQRKPEYAEPLLAEAIELYETQLGTDTPHYHSALNTMGLCCDDMCRTDEALEWFGRAAKAAGSLYGAEHWETKQILKHAEAVRRHAGEKR